MPKKPNYTFEKRQREMANQKKAEEKTQRKSQKSAEEHKGQGAAGEDNTPDA